MESTSHLIYNPNEDELIKINELAFDLLSWKDIAFYMNVKPVDFKLIFDDENSPLRIAYQSGRIKRKHELRKPILKMATQGSPQAEMLAIKFLDEQYYDEIDD